MTEESIGAPVDVTVVRLTGGDSHIWLDPALHVYVTAMGYPRGIEGQQRARMARSHRPPDWSAFRSSRRRRPGPPSGSLLRRSATVHSCNSGRLRHDGSAQ